MTVVCCPDTRRPRSCWPPLGFRMEKRPSRSADAGGFFRALRRLLTVRRRDPHADSSVTQPTAIGSDMEQRLRGNERIWAGFREIEIRMLAAGPLHAGIGVLSRGVPRFFPGVHAVSVPWLDPDYEATHLLEQAGGAAAHAFVALHPPISGADT